MENKKIEAVYLGPESSKSGRFMSLSVLLHASMLATVTFMSIPKYDTPVREVVEIEVASDTIGPKPIADGTPAEASQGAPEIAAPAPAPKAQAAPAPAPQAEKAPPMPESIPEAPKAAIVAPTIVKAAPTMATKSAPSAPAPAHVAAAVETIDDIKTPDLETSDSGEVAVAKLEDKDLSDDFEKVDNDHNKKLKEVQKNLDDEAAKEATAHAAALAQAEKENQEEAKALAAANEARRAKDAKAIANAQAAEKAAADKAARETADREAKEAALAAAEASKGAAEQGEGTGVSGSPAPTKEVDGIPGGVRALDQLRQKPGNKLPQYSREERLAGQQGQTVFYAYVNTDGTLSQFKMGQSTGFRNLDAKTLAALKNWKFYPGQEGWVEMPYNWVLKGDAMEAGGQLRDKAR
jgi:TonB family protein